MDEYHKEAIVRLQGKVAVITGAGSGMGLAIATMTNIGESMPSDRLDAAGAERTLAFAALAPAYLDPGDIAALALFLASDESRTINGAIIPADAGWAAV